MNADASGKTFFLTGLLSTVFMTGLIWFVQVVHYPLFARVGAAGYAEYQAAHQQLTAYVVMPPMLIEMATAWLLLVWRPPQIESWVVWIAWVLVLVIWLSTFFLQVPQHEILGAGFNAQAHETLVRTNWIRTWAWSLRAAFMAYGLWRLLK